MYSKPQIVAAEKIEAKAIYLGSREYRPLGSD